MSGNLLRREFLIDLATGQRNDISVPEGLLASQGTPDSDRNVIKYLQIKYKTQLEPKEKEENHRNTKTPEHQQLAIQVKKDRTLSWLEQFGITCKRTFKERCRDYFNKLRLVQSLGIALKICAAEEESNDFYKNRQPQKTSTLHACYILRGGFFSWLGALIQRQEVMDPPGHHGDRNRGRKVWHHLCTTLLRPSSTV